MLYMLPALPGRCATPKDGFAGEKRFGLAPFAQRFAARGLAVYLFDYPCFPTVLANSKLTLRYAPNVRVHLRLQLTPDASDARVFHAESKTLTNR